jgi:hypothetical protein
MDQRIECPVTSDLSAGETDFVFEIAVAALIVDADPVGFELFQALVLAGIVMPLCRTIHAIVIASTTKFPSD